MGSAEDGDKGGTVEEPHLCPGEKQVQSAAGSDNRADKEGLEPQQESRQGVTSFCRQE